MSGVVKTINGGAPDDAGNITVDSEATMTDDGNTHYGLSLHFDGTVASFHEQDALKVAGRHVISFTVPDCTYAPSGIPDGTYDAVLDTVSSAHEKTSASYYDCCRQILTIICNKDNSWGVKSWERGIYQAGDEDMVEEDWTECVTYEMYDDLSDDVVNHYRELTALINERAVKKNSDGGFEGGENAAATTGGAVGKNAAATTGGAVGENASGGIGFAGGNAASVSDGGCAAGNYSSTESGGAVGSEAESLSGFAGGYCAKCAGMGACAGNSSYAFHGGAVGNAARAGDGFAGGNGASCGIAANGADVDCIQLGTGINGNERTLQVYNKRITDADGNLVDVGALSDLATSEKGTIVGAVNELAAHTFTDTATGAKYTLGVTNGAVVLTAV